MKHGTAAQGNRSDFPLRWVVPATKPPIQINERGCTTGYSSVGRASDCRVLQQSDGPWFDSGWPDYLSTSRVPRSCIRLCASQGKLEPAKALGRYQRAEMAAPRRCVRRRNCNPNGQRAEHALRNRTVVASIATGGCFLASCATDLLRTR